MKFSRINKIPLFNIRSSAILIFVIIVTLSAFKKNSLGMPCAMNVFGIPIICPFGALQITLGSRSISAEMLIGALVASFLIFLLGRAFCAWACPTLLFKQNGKGLPAKYIRNSGQESSQKNDFKISYGILGGALVSSLIFGFPVFCLICPVGLFFGSIFAVVKVFNTHQPGLELLIFPAMFITEIVLFRKNCTRFCPVGALLRLISSFNPGFLRPNLEASDCLQTKGAKCGLCERSCPENIPLTNPSRMELANCTNCLECKDKCPTNSLTWWKFRKTP